MKTIRKLHQSTGPARNCDDRWQSAFTKQHFEVMWQPLHCPDKGRARSESIWQGVSGMHSNLNFSKKRVYLISWLFTSVGTALFWTSRSKRSVLCLEAKHTHSIHTVAASTLLTPCRRSSWGWQIQFRNLPASNYSSLLICFTCFRAILRTV